MNITLYKHWVDHASAGLAIAARDDIEQLKQDVNNGLSQLWLVETEKGQSWMITRIDVDGDNKELVVCCYQGCDLKKVADCICTNASEQGFNSVRFHTAQKGLNQLIIHLDFIPFETVYRKVLR